MRIKLHDDIEGHKSGETVDVPKERAEWYLVNGYASHADYNDDENPKTGVPAKQDPTLATNVEAKPNESLPEQMAAGLGTPEKPDADPIEARREPIELTNGKGNPEKAAAGKEKLEEAADATEPDQAPEADGDLVEQRAEVADDAEKASVAAAEAAAEAEAKEDGLEAATATTDAASDPAQKAATKARAKRS